MLSKQPAVPLCPDDGVCSTLAAVVRFAEQLKVVLAVQAAFVQRDDMVGLKPLAPPAAGNSAALGQLGYRPVKAALAVFADCVGFPGAVVAVILAPDFRVRSRPLATVFPPRVSVGGVTLAHPFPYRIGVCGVVLAVAFPYRISVVGPILALPFLRRFRVVGPILALAFPPRIGVCGVILAIVFPPALRALPIVPPLATVPSAELAALAAFAELVARVG